MPVVPLREILTPALKAGYGVAAINVVNDLTLESVLAAAVAERSPIIVQTSVKTVRTVGAGVFAAMWRSMTDDIAVPVSLHLDHCPDRAVITECLSHGWNSVLFDASSLPVEQNLRETLDVVAEARAVGADVEGEIESITGVEDGIGSDEVSTAQPLEIALDFIERTKVDVFAPAIGNAHGRYREAPTLDGDRVARLVDATGIPMALHGGSGLTPEQFTDLIAKGCAKVNLSTALKEVYMRSSLTHLTTAEESDRWDPPSLFADVRQAVMAMVTEHIQLFGSAARA